MLWTIHATDTLLLSALELINDPPQIRCTLQNLDLQFTAHDNGNISVAAFIQTCGTTDTDTAVERGGGVVVGVGAGKGVVGVI